MSTYHPDLAPYDGRCNETTAALEAGRKRYQAAIEELREATRALPALEAADREANIHWVEACAAFRELHSLHPGADLGAEATQHLPVHG